MEHVRCFLRYLVDVAGPPDQPAFLAPVSPTGLEFAPGVRDGQDGYLVRSVRLLSALDHGAARREHHDERNKEKIPTEKHGCLLKPQWLDGKACNSACNICCIVARSSGRRKEAKYRQCRHKRRLGAGAPCPAHHEKPGGEARRPVLRADVFGSYLYKAFMLPHVASSTGETSSQMAPPMLPWAMSV
jgi:hypothetical protein